MPLKIRIFSWLLRRGRILTRAYRARWAPESNCSCALCGLGVENIDHLFFECSIASIIWSHQGLTGVVTSDGDSYWASLRQLAMQRGGGWQRIWAVSMATTWAIWLQRNRTIFEGERCYVENILYHATFLIREWGFE